MECSKCHKQIPGDAKFCPSCGERIADVNQIRQQCIADAGKCCKAIAGGEGSRTYLMANFEQRLADWQQGAELGLAEAQWLLGRCFEEGFGVEKNRVHAISWHLKSAQSGFAPAQNHIGNCYLDGDGVAEDAAEAVMWFQKAAEAGYVTAQANLGWCYDTGNGVEVDEARAFEWFQKAAEQGDETAQFNLAVHFEYGSGVEQDLEKALEWYKRAAEAGYEKAVESLESIENKIAEQKKQRTEDIEQTKKEFLLGCQNALADGQIEFEKSSRLPDLAESLTLPIDMAKEIFEREKANFLQLQYERLQEVAAIEFRIACKNALANGIVTLEEKSELSGLARSLKMSPQKAREIFQQEKSVYEKSHPVKPPEQVESQFRQACQAALADGVLTDDERRQLTEMAKFFRIPGEVAKELFEDEKRKFLKSRAKKTAVPAEQQFRDACQKALEDGKVTLDEKHHLARLAKSLNMPKERAREVFEQEKGKILKSRISKGKN